MKTLQAESELSLIREALAKLHVRLFTHESSDAKWNAQRNLSGKTHYVDDDTLRFHHSRVLGTAILHGGLLLRVTCSDALDMHNTKRGFRCAVFDVFGTTVSRPTLEQAKSTKQAAIKASEQETIDLVKHYREAINSKTYHAQQDITDCNKTLAILPTPEPERAAA